MTFHLVFLIAFIIWSFPLSIFRSRFRKMVYETDSWWINVKPVFWKEMKVLVGLHNRQEIDDLKLITFYRLYLLVYVILLAGYLYS